MAEEFNGFTNIPAVDSVNTQDLILPEDLNQMPFSTLQNGPGNELILSPNSNEISTMYNPGLDDYISGSLADEEKELKTADLVKVKPEKNNVISEPIDKKRSAQPKARPALFVKKLWDMVNNGDGIMWSEDGNSFLVPDREAFMKILPKYFKHSNFSSFVRQLNMYGWHKLQDLSAGGLGNENDKWQFENRNFKRDREDLLDRIVRNKPNKADKEPEEELDVNLVVKELNKIKNNQSLIVDDLRRVKKDNTLLWQEMVIARDRYAKQNETLQNILRLILSVIQGSGSRDIDASSASSMINALFEAARKSNASSSKILAPEELSSDTSTKPRLMLENTKPEDVSKKSSVSRHKSVSSSATSASPLVELTPSGLSDINDLNGDGLSGQDLDISDATIGNLQQNISKQDENINNLAEIISSYMPKLEGSDEPSFDNFNVDDFFANVPSSPGTPTAANISEIPGSVQGSAPGSVKRVYENSSEETSPKRAKLED